MPINSAKRLTLVRRLNEMLPVPDTASLQLVLSLRSRLLAVRESDMLPADRRSLIRRLIADLVTAVAVVRHLAVLFENTGAILTEAQNAQDALACTARRWKNDEPPLTSDLDTLESFSDLFYNIIRETKLSEYKTVLRLVEKELSR